MLCEFPGTRTRKVAWGALRGCTDLPIPKKHTMPCDVLQQRIAWRVEGGKRTELIIRAVFTVTGGGEEGVGRGYREGVVMMEITKRC